MKSTKACLCVVLMVVLGGCSWLGPKVEVDRLTLDVASKANGDAPIAVDFIAVSDADLLKLLSSMTAKQWFSDREQYRRDYQQQLSVWSLELVPGQFMEARDFPLAGKSAAGLLVFAGYNTPGAHRMRLEQQPDIWLRFDSREMRLLRADAH
ncbi:type VI secretion protein [Pseudomonas sp. GD04087]|uniref:type VI secretion protein n=2 Tax=Pseudomonas TaxID=286 RepID=UPI001F282837|nr:MULTISPECIES: type VI secretion protein [Pseudomonas]MCP1649834.1 type VI secretion system protein [Pseudomonas nitroreducens]MCP1687437.1 type VI secretion system protein [Pseudomonas nitroreducens]MDH0292030.1 type VI secretion protein [Pseudomonas sp. GD04087]MDH1052628.1 type VI secretion protein [Pseudomonas sp. GD03903]MDH2003640.1 type VI secretion protein [Pseudomonas sp. GD03691]